MVRNVALAVAALLLVAGCGDDPESASTGGGSPPDSPTPTLTAPGTDAGPSSPATPSETPGTGPAAESTVITTGDSEFGEMLFDSNEQAIYLFEPESDGVPACYDDCAEAWPPVLTDGDPQAEGNIDAELLGTVDRDDGTTQVTYNGWPLYFYAHEDPGQVLCHNIVLNGGLWLVLGPDGNARPA